MIALRSVGLVLGAVSLSAQAPLPPEIESYAAHIAAAEGAAARGATAAVRRWLDAVPSAQRAFEWHLLAAEADQSSECHAVHEGGVTTLALSPDGSQLATAGNDGTIVLRSATTLAPIRTIQAHGHAVHCLAFDREGRRLASSSADRGAKIWDVASGTQLSAFTNHTHPVTTIRWAPDNERVCSTSYQRPKGGEVRIWSAADGKEIAVLLSGYAPITCSHWSQDGSKIVAASWDQHLHVFDLATPDRPRTTRLGPEPEYRAAQASALSPDGTLVAVACKDDQIHLFEAFSGTPVRDFVGHRKIVEGVAFSPDGKLLASGSADTTVRLWDVATGDCRAVLRGHGGLVRGLAFTHDGRALLTASADGTVRRWHIAKATSPARHHRLPSTAYHARESPDGRTLAVGFANGELRLYGVADGRELASLVGHADWIGSLHWHADSRQLVSSGNDQVAIWDTAERKLVRAFAQKGVDAAAPSHDATWLAATARDGKSRLWEIATGELRWTIEHKGTQTRLQWAPDDSVLAITGQAGAALHEPATGALRQPLGGHRGRVSALAFAPVGHELWTLGEDGAVCVWNWQDGTLLHRQKLHDGSGRALALSPDGKRVAACGEDDRLVLLDAGRRAEVWSRDVRDGYCLAWSQDSQRLWVLPLAKELFCYDAVPLVAR